jgi:hypothetical protein
LLTSPEAKPYSDSVNYRYGEEDGPCNKEAPSFFGEARIQVLKPRSGCDDENYDGHGLWLS